MNLVALELENLPIANNQVAFIFQGQEVNVVALFKQSNGVGSTLAQTPEEKAELRDELKDYKFEWTAVYSTYSVPMESGPQEKWKAAFRSGGAECGVYTIRLTIRNTTNRKSREDSADIALEVRQPVTARGGGTVTLSRSSAPATRDVALWQAIRQGAEALSFENYEKFLENVVNDTLTSAQRRAFANAEKGRGTPFVGITSYQMLKTATEVFVSLGCRVVDEKPYFDKASLADYNERNDRSETLSQLQGRWTDYLETANTKGPKTKTLPYLALIRRRMGEQAIIPDPEDARYLDVMDGILQHKLGRPCFFELIWSYWMEEGMLVQTMNALAVRFQNRRASVGDPLANLTIAPLHPISSVLFGYIQDEQHRLSLARRAYEYDHAYGFTLQGKAVPTLQSVDSRSKFLAAFHNLLSACVTFYKQDDNTTVIADGFPVLNALKEVNLLLTEGMHNQFGDLPTVARIEMLLQQWIIARPEIREFIGGRPMVPYAEPWMDRVDAMKKLQGWSDTSITYFYDLARFGEQLLLSIRYGLWSEIFNSSSAVNWARDFRPEVQQYVHAYRAVTGVDLGVPVTDSIAGDRLAPPSEHLRRRLEVQRTQGSGSNGTGAPSPVRKGRSRPAIASARPAAARPEMEFTEDY
jgi:hypothetical protein